MNEYYNTPNIFNRHYIQLNSYNQITNGFSDAFRQPTDTDICINEKGGYQFRLFPNGEENPPLFEGMGAIPLYEYKDGQVKRRPKKDLEADRIAEQERMEKARIEAERNSPQAQLERLSEALDELLMNMM